jgi:hypothetical protein
MGAGVRQALELADGTRPINEFILPFSMVRGTRGYIEKVVNQINGCYEKAWFDGGAVMMRRLIETLIIECFEKHKIADKIKDPKTGRLSILSRPHRQGDSRTRLESRKEREESAT